MKTPCWIRMDHGSKEKSSEILKEGKNSSKSKLKTL